MAILVQEKDVLFTAVNVVLFLFAFAYIILYNLSIIAYQMSGEVAPLESSGIYVSLAFAQMIFVVAITVTALVDMWWIFRIVRKAYTNYRRENL